VSQARATMYANQKDEGHEFTVYNKYEELAALAEGCRALPPAPVPPPADWKDEPPPPEYPKVMVHPGYPNGAATGMLMKDFRGKNAEQVVWKFDAALEAKLMEALKQAAIEEGQWTEKRDFSATVGIGIIKTRLDAGRQRVADAKVAREAAAAKA
jgi:hypothetical protein